MNPKITDYFSKKIPSATRIAHTEFLKRPDQVKAINVSTGNVSLPINPAMQKRMNALFADQSPFKTGVVKYSETQGFVETRSAFLHIFESSGYDISQLKIIVTEGASFAMEVVILGVSGKVGKIDQKLLLIDPSYTSYEELAKRTGRNVISTVRTLKKDGRFTLPDLDDLKDKIDNNNVGALLLIPYDNPTGQFINQKTINEIAKLCVQQNIWLVSDEAYRNMHYTGEKASSVWNISEKDVKGITGSRISIESSSKIWNGCGLRIGAIVTDNNDFYDKALAESTGNLCPSVISQYLFGALTNESAEQIDGWYKTQKKYYQNLIYDFVQQFRKINPGVVISLPDASIYSVIDVTQIVDADFDSADFVMFCAQKGMVQMEDGLFTLLTCPMKGFYVDKNAAEKFGKKQMRIAYVESAKNMAKVPYLFKQLLKNYLKDRKR